MFIVLFLFLEYVSERLHWRFSSVHIRLLYAYTLSSLIPASSADMGKAMTNPKKDTGPASRHASLTTKNEWLSFVRVWGTSFSFGQGAGAGQRPWLGNAGIMVFGS